MDNLTIDVKTFAAVVSLLVVFAGIIASHARNSIRIDYLEKELKATNDTTDKHIASTAIHIDPQRDEHRWNEILRRLGRIEEKLEHPAPQITVHAPPPISS
jgi:hypothetical protein